MINIVLKNQMIEGRLKTTREQYKASIRNIKSITYRL